MGALGTIQYALGIASGALVGLTLGLVGGGGSILATPLIVYVVGVADAHIAIGTSAFAVAMNAALSLAGHARARTVKWRCGLIYAAAGMAGAAIGSTIGKAIDGRALLIVFALLMICVGVVMLRRRHDLGIAGAQCTRQTLPRVLRYAVGSGTLSGFFGIGGGFLIVPGLMAATRMPMINAVGTSLVAVSAFGFTTAANYAWSGYIDWLLVGLFVLGGAFGSAVGMYGAQRFARSSGSLQLVFAGCVIATGIYIVVTGLMAAL